MKELQPIMFGEIISRGFPNKQQRGARLQGSDDVYDVFRHNIRSGFLRRSHSPRKTVSIKMPLALTFNAHATFLGLLKLGYYKN